MKKRDLFLFITLTGVFVFLLSWARSNKDIPDKHNHSLLNPRIDNIGYWVKQAEAGLIPFNPEIKLAPAIFTGSNIQAYSVVTNDSPDIPLTEINSTQSENSVFVNPLNADNLLNSNNSTDNPVPLLGGIYGANDFYSFDTGETWNGEITGAGGNNNGDPTTAIGLNGRWYINYISGSLGQAISFSDDEGETWTSKTVAGNPGEIADKNHMCIDNSPSSPYEGNLYIAWTDFGGSNHEEIVLARSIDNGETWIVVGNISGATDALDHGVHLSTGKNGEVYAVWAVYDSQDDENAIGFTKSTDGGETWMPAVRAINNIRGIRVSETSKSLRVNSFPVSAVDVGNSSGSGNIYVVWTNIGEPGINTGNNIDIYLIRSSDKGESWSDPIRVNQDEQGLGKEHFFPWISCDPSNGFLSVIFYDDRNVSGNQCEVFCANSDDGGESWEDFKVGDVAFTPAPIPGLAVDYFGDYLGITALNGWVYPVWTDNRLGHAMSWCSPYQTNNLSRPQDLVAEVTFETGEVQLRWNYEEVENFQNFNIYRDNALIATANDTAFVDQLSTYGSYKYRVTAYYSDGTESGGSSVRIQWGNAQIKLEENDVSEHLTIDSSSVKTLAITNTGQLDLVFHITQFITTSREILDYCEASGGGTEHIEQVLFGDIDNSSGSNNYSDYTHLETSLETGGFYEIFVNNGDAFKDDQCGAWIDWDQNGLFDDGMIPFNGSPGFGPYTATFTPPIGAKTGHTRLRIRLTYTGELKPCGNTIWGEVEDYSVYVKNWFDVEPLSDTILPGKSTELVIGFDATDYEPGINRASLLVSSNDPDNEQATIELTLQVSEKLVGASTESGRTSFCSGENIQLQATPFGVFDTVSYSWYSRPEGFESTLQNPVADPTDSLWYFVEMTDYTTYSIDSIFLNILPQPQFSLGTDTIYCGDTIVLLDAGTDGVFYQWSTGDTSNSIVVDTTTLFGGFGEREISVLVYNDLKCSTRDTVRIEFVNCTGIFENPGFQSVNVFPNPNSGVFKIEFDGSFSGQVDIIVFNQLGMLVYSRENILYRKDETLEINLENHQKGVYQLFIKNKNYLTNRKIIVK